MRFLIGNHIDPSIRARGDMRAWTQRLFWFARPGDLLVLCCAPDAEFAGVRREDLTVLAVPPGVWGEKLLDPACLTTWADPSDLLMRHSAWRPLREGRWSPQW
ncbi:preATP grasp domain-containing protein [Streptomyces sp. NPDC055099]